jgi:hypothetical protein
MNFDDLRRRAAVVRELPLETVLLFRDAVRDRYDPSKWHTERGPLSVTGAKFINWRRGRAGGGAIDLVMHLADVDFRTALAWLEEHLAAGHLASSEDHTHDYGCQHVAADERRGLWLPRPDRRMLSRVYAYLTRERHLSASILEPLVESGRLYADRRGNAVFVLVAGKANRPVGAELRGTGSRPWRGMAPGTCKDSGYFWVGDREANEIVLCESAIDAISCFQLQPQRICISTAGVRANPGWLSRLIQRGYHIYCGFDADGAGDDAAGRMIALHPTITRLRPPAHDWNDALAANR